MLNSREEGLVRRGLAFFEMASLMQTLNVDCIPLQLKALSSEQLTAYILGELPLGHLNVDSLEAADESLDLSADEETLRQLKLHSQPLPAKKLIEAVLAVHGDPADLDARTKVLLAVNARAVQLNDMKACFLLCMELLRNPEHLSVLSNAVIDACMGLVKKLDANDSEGSYMRRNLEANLLIFKPELATVVSETNSSKPTNLDDEGLISEAHSLLLKLIGAILTDVGDRSMLLAPIAQVEEVVRASSATSTLSDIVAYLHAASNKGNVECMLQKMVSDLQRKMSSSSKMTEELTPMVAVNEAVVEQLLSMGFPRNAALKAAMGTRSAEDAVTWAIEHSSDLDFNEPISRIVEGGLLPESSGLPTNILNIQRCLDVVRWLHETVGGATSIRFSRLQSAEDTTAEPPTVSTILHLEQIESKEISISRMGSEGDAGITIGQRGSALQSALSRATHLAKLQSIIDVAEDFTGLLASQGVSVSAFSSQLSDGDSGVKQLLEELLLALASHTDLAAYSLLPKILDAIPQQLLEIIDVVVPGAPAVENLAELPFAAVEMSLNELIVWELGRHRLLTSFRLGKGDEELKADCEVLFGCLAKHPTK